MTKQLLCHQMQIPIDIFTQNVYVIWPNVKWDTFLDQNTYF